MKKFNSWQFLLVLGLLFCANSPVSSGAYLNSMPEHAEEESAYNSVDLLHATWLHENFMYKQCEFFSQYAEDKKYTAIHADLIKLRSNIERNLQSIKVLLSNFIINQEFDISQLNSARLTVEHLVLLDKHTQERFELIKESLLNQLSPEKRKGILEIEWKAADSDFRSGAYRQAQIKLASIKKLYQQFFQNMELVDFKLAACLSLSGKPLKALDAYRDMLGTGIKNEFFYLSLERLLTLALQQRQETAIDFADSLLQIHIDEIPEKHRNRLFYLAAQSTIIDKRYADVHNFTNKISNKSRYFLPGHLLHAETLIRQNDKNAAITELQSFTTSQLLKKGRH
ncbi:MAG: hypothetical protein DWQ10_06085, partial [Calditrichaeota bacterium]